MTATIDPQVLAKVVSENRTQWWMPELAFCRVRDRLPLALPVGNLTLEQAFALLSDLGLHLAGCSSKSASKYFAFFPGEDEPRLRLSDHAVAYASSDCAVCLGNAQDDDVQLTDADSVIQAVKLLFWAQVDREVQTAVDDFEREHDGEVGLRGKQEMQKTAIEWVIACGLQGEKQWLHLFFDLSAIQIPN